jgi:hypothetical protein
VAALAVITVSFAAGGAGQGNATNIGVGMVRLLADVFPVAAGLAAVTAAAGDRLIEVLLSLPTGYPTLVRRRVTVVVVLMTMSAGAAVIVLALAGQWANPAWGPLALLVPMGPAILLIGTATFAQAALRSSAAASTVVIAAWLVQVLLVDQFIGYWVANRLFLIAAGAILFMLGMRRLSDSEGQLARTGGGAE